MAHNRFTYTFEKIGLDCIIFLSPGHALIWLMNVKGLDVKPGPCKRGPLFTPNETEGPWPLHFQALSLVEKAEPVRVRFNTLRLRDQWSKWMQDGCKVDMDYSYSASNGSCFMVAWTIFKTRFLEVGLTQNGRSWHYEISQLLGYHIFYHVWGPCMNKRLLK